MIVDIDNGKYSIVIEDNGANLRLLRHGVEWFTPVYGSNMLIAAAHEIAYLRAALDLISKKCVECPDTAQFANKALHHEVVLDY